MTGEDVRSATIRGRPPSLHCPDRRALACGVVSVERPCPAAAGTGTTPPPGGYGSGDAVGDGFRQVAASLLHGARRVIASLGDVARGTR